jgi:hypothetical protein
VQVTRVVGGDRRGSFEIIKVFVGSTGRWSNERQTDIDGTQIAKYRFEG